MQRGEFLCFLRIFCKMTAFHATWSFHFNCCHFSGKAVFADFFTWYFQNSVLYCSHENGTRKRIQFGSNSSISYILNVYIIIKGTETGHRLRLYKLIDKWTAYSESASLLKRFWQQSPLGRRGIGANGLRSLHMGYEPCPSDDYVSQRPVYLKKAQTAIFLIKHDPF